MIDLYFWPTGNGKKTVILLEELGLPYTFKPINIGRGDQLTPAVPEDFPQRPDAGHRRRRTDGRRRADLDFRVRRDHDLPRRKGPGNSSRPIRAANTTSLQWVNWQMANQGPKLGEQGHFRRAKAAGTNGDLATRCAASITKRTGIFGVLNLGLFNKQYLAAGQYTIADMICYPWASSWETRDIDIDEFPNVKRWLEEIGARPAVKKAMALGPEFREDPASISPEEQQRRRNRCRPARATGSGGMDTRGVGGRVRGAVTPRHGRA